MDEFVARSGDQFPGDFRMGCPELGRETLHSFADDEELVQYGRLCLQVGEELGLFCRALELDGQTRSFQYVQQVAFIARQNRAPHFQESPCAGSSSNSVRWPGAQRDRPCGQGCWRVPLPSL